MSLGSLFRVLSADEHRALRRQVMGVFIVITLLNLGFYWQRAFREIAVRRNVPSVMRGWDGMAWYVWMLAAPATLLLIRRVSFRRDGVARGILYLTAGSAAIYFVVTNTRFLLRILPNAWLPPDQHLPVSWPIYFSTQIERTPLDFLTYCGLFAASLAIDAYTKNRQRAEEIAALELRAAQLESDLVRSQLAALRGQLHPHFLFNAFNAISTLIRQHKVTEAIDTIARLGELLRFVMENIDQQVLPLRRELELAQSYLDVERVRFGEKLAVSIEVAPIALDGLVPTLLLQPVIENAIKHGIARRSTPGCIRIAAAKRGGRLRIEITDDGVGEGGTALMEWQPGVGLNTTRRRLDHAYGEDYELDFVRRPEGGTIVLFNLPWRTAAGPRSDALGGVLG